MISVAALDANYMCGGVVVLALRLSVVSNLERKTEFNCAAQIGLGNSMNDDTARRTTSYWSFHSSVYSTSASRVLHNFSGGPRRYREPGASDIVNL
jgi:hypothetical protein